MLISLDYDDTFTADPTLWRGFVAHAQCRGHQVICVTGRNDCEGNRREMSEALPEGTEIVFCGIEPKAKMARAAGYVVDVWIDDFPGCIEPGSY